MKNLELRLAVPAAPVLLEYRDVGLLPRDALGIMAAVRPCLRRNVLRLKLAAPHRMFRPVRTETGLVWSEVVRKRLSAGVFSMMYSAASACSPDKS